MSKKKLWKGNGRGLRGESKKKRRCFLYEKKVEMFFWTTISMWNFVRNPFLATINATEQHLVTLNAPNQSALFFSQNFPNHGGHLV